MLRAAGGALVLAHSLRRAARRSCPLRRRRSTWFARARSCGLHVDVKGGGFEDGSSRRSSGTALPGAPTSRRRDAPSVLRRFAELAPELPRALTYPEDRLGISRRAAGRRRSSPAASPRCGGRCRRGSCGLLARRGRDGRVAEPLARSRGRRSSAATRRRPGRRLDGGRRRRGSSRSRRSASTAIVSNDPRVLRGYTFAVRRSGLAVLFAARIRPRGRSVGRCPRGPAVPRRTTTIPTTTHDDDADHDRRAADPQVLPAGVRSRASRSAG